MSIDRVAGFCYSLPLDPEDIMQFKIGEPRRRLVWLALALSASVMQVLGSSLPSLVVCYKADRPPRVEFFSNSCSCRQADIHSCSPQGGHGAPCLEEDCTDVHLRSHVLLAAPPLHQRPFIRVRRLTPRSGWLMPGTAIISLRPEPNDRGAPRAEFPPPLSVLNANSPLRC